MIYSILKTELDLEELNNKIVFSSRDSQYLIMNSLTYETLVKQAVKPDLQKFERGAWYYSSYKGLYIAICENLNYGEVDII